MRFKILKYREYDNDYVALLMNKDKKIEVIVDPFVTNAIEYEDRHNYIGNTFCDNNTSSEPYPNVFLPKVFDLIEEIS